MVVGDKLTENEADDLLKGVNEKGVIDYRVLAAELTK